MEETTPSRTSQYTPDPTWYRPVIGVPCGGAQRVGARYPLLGMVDVEQDALELELVCEALTWQMPLLGINRGMHLLNVACGGSLYQDLRGQLGAGVWPHVTTRQPRTYLAHTVSVVPQTRLAALVQKDLVLVNSFHHQGIKRLGTALSIGALAPDDVIESYRVGRGALCGGGPVVVRSAGPPWGSAPARALPGVYRGGADFWQ